MPWVSSLDVIRELKEQRKLEREAQKEQDKRNRELTKKTRVSVSRKIALFDAKTLSQMEAATLLDCVIGVWNLNRHATGPENKISSGLLRAKEAAAYLDISVRLFYYLAQEGKIVRHNLRHRTTRYKKSDLDDYIKSCRSTSINPNNVTDSDSRKPLMERSNALANSFLKAGVKLKPKHMSNR